MKIFENEVLSEVYDILNDNVQYHIGIENVRYTPEEDRIVVDLSGGKAAVISVVDNTINIEGGTEYCVLIKKIIEQSL